jgi:hypothetical protein
MGENVEKIVDHVGGRCFKFRIAPAERATESESVESPVRRGQIFRIYEKRRTPSFDEVL